MAVSDECPARVLTYGPPRRNGQGTHVTSAGHAAGVVWRRARVARRCADPQVSGTGFNFRASPSRVGSESGGSARAVPVGVASAPAPERSEGAVEAPPNRKGSKRSDTMLMQDM